METNFGDATFSQFNVASNRGLCLAKPPHAAESLTTTSRPIFPNTAPGKKHRHTQRPRLPIGLARRGLVLVEAQQLKVQSTARNADSVAKKGWRQNPSAARSCFNSSIRCSMQARWL